MTERAQQRSGGRPASDGGMAWKSGLLGASLGAALLGWGLLTRDSGAAQEVIPTPVQPQIIIVRVPVQSWPVNGETTLVSQSLAQVQPAAVNIAPLPPKPVFQQPITRTRRS